MTQNLIKWLHNANTVYIPYFQCEKITNLQRNYSQWCISWTQLDFVTDCGGLCEWIMRMDTSVKHCWFKGTKIKFLYLRSLYIQSTKANESKDFIRISTAIICNMEALNIFCEFSIAKKKGWGNKETTLIKNTHYHLFISQISFQE